jgi:hypothetical protein
VKGKTSDPKETSETLEKRPCWRDPCNKNKHKRMVMGSRRSVTTKPMRVPHPEAGKAGDEMQPHTETG